uniref:Uncharacterized protein n=1 Tax=Manihot esculenta TaxID=3983 RepID=A0A199UA74_MANES
MLYYWSSICIPFTFWFFCWSHLLFSEFITISSLPRSTSFLACYFVPF